MIPRADSSRMNSDDAGAAGLPSSTANGCMSAMAAASAIITSSLVDSALAWKSTNTTSRP